jgi:hypothetical protein
MQEKRQAVAAEYERKLALADKEYVLWSHRAGVGAIALMFGAVVLLGALWGLIHSGGSLRFAAAALCGEIALLILRSSLVRSAQQAARRSQFYELALARVQGTALQTGHTGEAFSRPGHLYERDLNVLGPNSLFEMLATTRTAIGQRGLARFLLGPVEAEEARQRQKAIRELSAKVDLREQIGLLGRWSFQELPADGFKQWLNVNPSLFPQWTRIGLPLLTMSWILCGFVGLILHVNFGTLEMELGGLLALQGALCLWLAPRVKEELESAQKLGSQTAILREGLQLISRNNFSAALLQSLQRNAEDKDRALAKLQREVMLVEQRVKEWYYVPCLLLAVGTEKALCLNAWKRNHSADMQRWLDVWGEFEALLALSTYAAEHPENVYPEIEDHNPDDTALLVARGAKHPLLNPDQAVANDIVLGMAQDAEPAIQVLMISGSNMAGKSTLLRTVGTNIILALAGAPIPAREARLCVFRLAVSIAVNDSLAEGKSKFLAEVERLRAMVTLAQENHGRTLFLIDEIFSGTNSLDRRVATEHVIGALVKTGAVGAVSTHDLTLTEIAELPDLRGRNIHMASWAEDDPLAFDYLIKPGINRATNGLAIVRMLGLLN